MQDFVQKLIFLTGEAWTGKSTIARLLYQRLENSAWLDGDDVWRVNPMSFDDPRLRNSDVNMAFVLETYLKSNFEYVILSSIVLCKKTIRERILELIKYQNYELIVITLHASKEILRERAKQRDGNENPQFRLLEESLAQKSIFIDTSTDSAENIVEKIKNRIQNQNRENGN